MLDVRPLAALAAAVMLGVLAFGPAYAQAPAAPPASPPAAAPATADDDAIIRMPLKELLGGLDHDVFWQVHRGVLVRVQAIDRVRKDELGRHQLSVKGRKDVLPVSAAFQHHERDRLDHLSKRPTATCQRTGVHDQRSAACCDQRIVPGRSFRRQATIA